MYFFFIIIWGERRDGGLSLEGSQDMGDENFVARHWHLNENDEKRDAQNFYFF